LIKKYRKKPLIIQAEQKSSLFFVDTVEGRMSGGPGDYLVTGIHGEKYPMKKAIFEDSYEEVK